MFYRPMIEVEDGAAFLTMAKDLKPVGRVVVFEYDKDRYKFFSRQGDDLVAVSYAPKSIFPVSTPQGRVSHSSKAPYRTLCGKCDHVVKFDHVVAFLDRNIYKKLGVTTRKTSRTRKLIEAVKKCLASSKPTTMRWKSNDEKITNLTMKVHSVNNAVTITIEYTDVSVRELTKMLGSAGYKVVPGKISMQ